MNLRVLAALALGCLTTAAAAADLDPVFTAKWLAVEIRGKQVNTERQPWVQFREGGHAGRHDGCNAFGAMIRPEGGRVRAERWSLFQTAEACGGGEGLFTGNLLVASSYEVDADSLVFADESGQAILRLHRSPIEKNQ